MVLKGKEGLKGIWIERVIPGSPVERAGLLPEDQFVAIEEKEIKELKDIHGAFFQKGWAKEITITILREEKIKEVKIALSPLKD